MSSSSFKSSSRKPSSSSSTSTTTTINKQQQTRKQNPTHKPVPRRSRSVSAFSRTHFDKTSEFQNKRDNPLFSLDGSEEDIDGVKLKGLSNFETPKNVDSSGGGESRRGRSVSRNSGGVTRFPGGGGGGRKDVGRSLSRVDTLRRRRSTSRGHYGYSESEREQESEISNFRSKSKLSSNANPALLDKKKELVRSASDMSEIMKGRNTWSSQHPAIETSDDSVINLSGSQTPVWDDALSTTSSISEVEEKTIKPVSEEKITPSNENNGTTGRILETVRSEVRRAFSDMQNDLKHVMLRSNSDAIHGSVISDATSELETPDAFGLVEDFREEFARELEECEERTRKLRAELAVEEHRENELNKMLNDIVPEPKTPVVQKPCAVRKASFERKKMSRHLEEEALAYFDECVSISTFDESDFSSLEDLPSMMGSVDGPGSGRLGLPGVSCRASDSYTFESQRDSPRRSRLNNSVTTLHSKSLNEDIRNYVKNFSKDSGSENSNSDIIRISHRNTEDYYTCEVPMEKLLLDRVTFKSRIESGSMLLCGGGVSFSGASFLLFCGK